MPFNEKATRGMKPKEWITILAMMIYVMKSVSFSNSFAVVLSQHHTNDISVLLL